MNRASKTDLGSRLLVFWIVGGFFLCNAELYYFHCIFFVALDYWFDELKCYIILLHIC
jgi:hypothetical protein